MGDLLSGKTFTRWIQRYRTGKKLKTLRSRFNSTTTNLKDPVQSGIISRPCDIEYERPSKTQPENIFVYAANEKNQKLTLNLIWSPTADENCGLLKVNLSLFGYADDPDYVYEYKRCQRIYNLDNYHDYTCGGFKLEIFCPLKRIKIRLNDFCQLKPTGKDNDDPSDYKFINLCALLFPVQEIYDHLNTYEPKFISGQLTSSLSAKFPFTDLADIGTHVKLHLTHDGRSTESDLWGLRSKLRCDPDEYKIKQLVKFSGYALKKGYNFSITFIEKAGSWYINGYSGWGLSLIFPISSTSVTRELINGTQFDFTVSNRYRKFTVTANKMDGGLQSFYSLTIDGSPGVGHFIRLPFSGNEIDFDTSIIDFGPTVGYIPTSKGAGDILTVPLNQPLAMNPEISGGKGSSLAKLTNILIDNPHLGQVPPGLIVTTKAYELMSTQVGLSSLIAQLKRRLDNMGNSDDEGILEAECRSMVDEIGATTLPETIRKSIEAGMEQLFNDSSGRAKFAVRSSAFGEDSSELSCAGQMETFLGISSLDQIHQCVMKCWASQFRFVAIKYKLTNGLDLNLSMAVVIQKMVDCDQAGVLFTCDPVTGEPLTAVITANYGLGESIVSSTSDPDTIKVRLKMSTNGLTIASSTDVQIGRKEKIIKLSETGDGTTTIESQSSGLCCLSEGQINNLTTTCLKFASYFDGPCDFEWGFQSDQIYLFQCRPVTATSASTLLDWELSHEIDSPHVSSNEYHTRANLGEVYPGSTSHICHVYQMPSSSLCYVEKYYAKLLDNRFMPYVVRGLVFSRHHCFFALKDGIFFTYDTPPEQENILATSMEYSMLGQKIDDIEMKRDSFERLTQFQMQSKFEKLKFMLDTLFMGPRRLRKVQLSPFQSKVDSNSSSHEMLMEIFNSSEYLWDAFLAHLNVTIGSSMMNLFVISALAQADKKSPTILTDFSKLLASCQQVVSAQIPVIIKSLASKVTDEKEKSFILNSDNRQVEDYLLKGTSQLAVNYRAFIESYGHRGWKEFDFAGKVWRKDPSFVINPLRSLLSIPRTSEDSKGDDSGNGNKVNDEQLIASLETSLSSVTRFLLRKFLLPWCRSFVSLREEGKNKLIWKIDQMRRLYDQMAFTLANKENRLPDPTLAYCLMPDELIQLTQASNPGLVLLAKRRQKVLQKVDSYEFPIILAGPSMLPNNIPSVCDTDEHQFDIQDGSEIMGTPVSQGKITGSLFVARTLQEAVGIKPGDILVTYSTDIGWSPYFPIIGGLITEIGGLISHGAVIAREFGLPCIVGVNNACKIFRTGDQVSMDASKGIIIKAPSQQD